MHTAPNTSRLTRPTQTRARGGIMRTLRRMAPVLSVMLMVFVAVQVMDLAPCADETAHHEASPSSSLRAAA